MAGSSSSSAPVTWTIIAEFRNWRETFSLFSFHLTSIHRSTYFSLPKKKKRTYKNSFDKKSKQRNDMSTRLVAKNKRCEQGVMINQGGQAKRLLPSQPDDGLWRHYIVFYTASRYAVAHLDSAARSFGFGFTPRPREDPRHETNYYTNSCSPYVRRM